MPACLSTKAVAVGSKNVFASIVAQSASQSPYLRFAFDTVQDYGLSSSGKMSSIAASNDLLGTGDGQLRIGITAYRKAGLANKDIIELINKEVKDTLTDAEEGETFGGRLAHRTGRGFVARGSTKDGTIFLDIPSTTISVLANPHTTFKERDLVAPPSNKGTKRLIMSSSGFSSVLNGAIGMNFNVMMEVESTITAAGLAQGLGVALDDPLLVSLLANTAVNGGAAASATAGAFSSSSGAPATVSAEMAKFSNAVRAYLQSLTQEQITAAVEYVFEAKLRIAGSSAPSFEVVSKLKVDTARTWVIAHLVETAIAKVRLDFIINGGDVSDLSQFMPISNAEVIDLFDSTPDNDKVKAMVKESLLSVLQRMVEEGADEPATKKSRSEK